MLVSRRREAELLEALAAMVTSMPVGDPLDEKTHIGPMVSEKQRDNVERYIRIGMDEGARMLVGGLSGSVFSKDIERAIAAADRVKTGALEVNGAPFGSWNGIAAHRRGLGFTAGEG